MKTTKNRKLVPTLGERFKSHPCGQYCLRLTPGLELAELWQRPLTECLLLSPYIHAGGILVVSDDVSSALVKCWEGVPDNMVIERTEQGAPFRVRCDVVLNNPLPTTEEETRPRTEFIQNWCEAVLSFDPKLTVSKGHLLGRRPWTWTQDKDAITDILTRIAKKDLKRPVKKLPLLMPLRPGELPISGFEAWKRWFQFQSETVQGNLSGVVNGLIAQGFPPIPSKMAP